MSYVEVKGQSLKNSREKEREADLHHMRIYGHSDGHPDSPKWLVQHHQSEDDPRPKEFEFEDGAEMIRHVAEHASVPQDAHGPNDNLGRRVLPGPNDLQGANLSGRAR